MDEYEMKVYATTLYVFNNNKEEQTNDKEFKQMTDYLWRKGMIKFNLGQLVCTRTINEHFKNETTKKEIFSAIDKYITCDWGNLCEEDKKMNEYAIKNNNDRILAKYHIDSINEDIYIITEWDRSYTTVMFCYEY